MQVDASDYREFAAKLKQAPKEIQREIRKELRTTAKEIGKEVLEAGAKEQPQGGGLADWIIKTARLGVSIAQIRLELALGVKSGDLIRRLNNKGILRHPVFADPKKPRDEWSWTDQTKGVTKGAWTDDFLKRGGEVAERVAPAIERALRRLA